MATGYALYLATALGAAALYMMMPRKGLSLAKVGALLGAFTLGGLWLYLAGRVSGGGPASRALGGASMVYYYLFSAIAIGAGVRVITHTKPVYAALWFVMLMLSAAGMFLLLGAEFMAMALVIIYGGAILVTYVFVMMLATRAGGPDSGEDGPWYDRVAGEPAAAVAAGFLLLAVLLGVAFEPMRPNPEPRMKGMSDRWVIAHILSGRPEQVVDPMGLVPTVGEVKGKVKRPAAVKLVEDELDNAEKIGLDLFRSHPLGLELAGVLLLISLIGAVVIARQPVEAEAGGRK